MRRAGVLPALVLLLALTVGTCSAAAEAGSTTGDTIRLRNGDMLSGHLISIDPATVVRWRHADAVADTEFASSSVAEIELSRRPQPSAATNVNCRVRLQDDAVLEGMLLGMDPETLRLETWFAGALSVPRSQLRMLQTVAPPKPPIYEGPTGFEGWTIGDVQAQMTEPGKWQYRKGAFYARNAAAIARDVKLPEVSSLEFDLDWQSTFHIAVALYADSLQPISLATKDTEPEFGGFYSMQLNSYSADLLPVKRNEPLRYMGQVQVAAFSSQTSAHVEIRTDKRRRLVTLMVDGAIVKQWMDTTEFAGKGTAVRFVNQGRGGLKLSRIRVSEWDGRFDERPSLMPGASRDVALLWSGERQQGKVDGMKESSLMMVTNAGAPAMAIPIDTLRQVEFPPLRGGPAATNSPLSCVRFWDGGILHCTLGRWSDQGLAGAAAGMGTFTLHPGSVRRIQFAPIQEEPRVAP